MVVYKCVCACEWLYISVCACLQWVAYIFIIGDAMVSIADHEYSADRRIIKRFNIGLCG